MYDETYTEPTYTQKPGISDVSLYFSHGNSIYRLRTHENKYSDVIQSLQINVQISLTVTLVERILSGLVFLYVSLYFSLLT